MDLTSLIPDNLSDLLLKIVEFTTSRRALLHQNIRESRTEGFIPRDMPILEFAHAMNGAIAEHVQNRRLLFRDTENITFGPNGTMHVAPVPDADAQRLLQESPDEYLEQQIRKLLENALNRTVAEDLLKVKSEAPFGMGPVFTAGAPGQRTLGEDASPQPRSDR